MAPFSVNDAGASFTLGVQRSFTTAGDFTNNGTLTVGSGDTFNVNGNLTNFSGTTLTGGTYSIAGALQFNNANIASNAAAIVLTGPGSEIVNQTGSNALLDFSANSAAGSFTLAGKQNLTTAGGSFTNSGNFLINTGSTFTVGGATFNFTQNSGTTTVDGTLTSSSAGTLNLTGGSIFGDGTLAYRVVDAGTVTPGNSATATGDLSISKTYSKARLVPWIFQSEASQLELSTINSK